MAIPSLQCLVLNRLLKQLPGLQEQGGGVTGYLKSWIGGSPTETTPQGDAKTTHTQELQDGRSAAVRTAPDQATGSRSHLACCLWAAISVDNVSVSWNTLPA